MNIIEDLSKLIKINKNVLESLYTIIGLNDANNVYTAL